MTCEMCERFSKGGYDFGCDRCLARAYVRARKGEQDLTLRMWKESMDLPRFEQMQKYIAEAQAAEKPRKASG